MVVGASAALVIGCGDRGQAGTAESSTQAETAETSTAATPASHLRRIGITLDGHPGPENVGILIAEERGYFEDAGLDVSIFYPETPLRPVRYVTEGLVAFSISHQPEVVIAQGKGVPIIAVASLVSQPTAAMIWLKGSGIKKVADLKGKTIAIPGLHFQMRFLESVLAGAGLTLDDVKVQTVAYELVPALVSGRADAIFGGSWNREGAELHARGMKSVIVRVVDLGIPAYEELVLIARRDHAAKAPRVVGDFISAMERGVAAAIDDPEAAAEAILAKGYADDRRAVEAELAATLPLLSTDGRMDRQQAERLVDWMFEHGIISRKPPVSDLLNNDYLPDS
jgi:putative hydroxymethylpyrimidine transport system substrate-binding protein